MLERINGKLELKQTDQQEMVLALKEMRGDLVNLQKFASCTLSHLETVLRILERE